MTDKEENELKNWIKDWFPTSETLGIGGRKYGILFENVLEHCAELMENAKPETDEDEVQSEIAALRDENKRLNDALDKASKALRLVIDNILENV